MSDEEAVECVCGGGEPDIADFGTAGTFIDCPRCHAFLSGAQGTSRTEAVRMWNAAMAALDAA